MSALRFRTLDLQRFTVFQHAQFEFSPGLNVITGTNGSGKTHLMKLLYAYHSAWVTHCKAGRDTKEALETELGRKLTAVFRPDSLGRLVSRAQGRSMCHVSLGVNGLGTASTPTPVDFEFSTVAKGKVRLTSSKNPISDAQPSSATFLPVREMLTLAKGFIGMYAERDLGFDETYRDIAIQLDVPELLGPKQAGTKDMLAAYESVLEANTVFRQDGRFFFRLGGGNIEADLVAEGYRKLGNVIYLIKNGMLNPESVLFWDEPEANLNPRLVRPTAEFLLQLVRLGAQVFITTHDYLLVRTLGVMADNREAYSLGPDMVRFINLHTTSEKGTEVECAHSLFALQCNAILEEIEAHYRWEENLVLGQFTPS